jgi:signal transduction histidine kinase
MSAALADQAAPARSKPRAKVGRLALRSELASGGLAAPSGGDDFEFTLDRQWRITSITHDAAAWCGSSPGALIGRDSREAWAPPQPRVAEAVAAAFTTGATAILEQPSLFAPGRWVRVEVTPSGNDVRFRFEDLTSEVSVARPAQAPGTLGAYSLGVGPAEIVLLDRRGVIVGANSAWRAALMAHGVDVPDAGHGMLYADVCKAAIGDLDVDSLRKGLEPLLSGRVPRFGATYTLSTPHGRELRQVQIAPLQDGGATRFAAIHEDLTERARILATLDETSDQLLHAQEQERQRIAIELHDSTSQHLAGLVLGLNSLKRQLGQSGSAQARIDELSELAQQAVRETRVLSFLMNASGREREKLEAALRRFVEGFGRRTGLELAFRVKGDVDAISAATQHAVFRVVQEALSNVYRHARATKVSVTVANQAGILTACISDNGQGFEAEIDGGEAPPLGVGIPGMRARIEQLGGALRIAGGRGGATVVATLPVRRPALNDLRA